MLATCLLEHLAGGLKSSACNVRFASGASFNRVASPFFFPAALVALHPFLKRVLQIRHAQVCYGKVVRVAIQ